MLLSRLLRECLNRPVYVQLTVDYTDYTVEKRKSTARSPDGQKVYIYLAMRMLDLWLFIQY